MHLSLLPNHRYLLRATQLYMASRMGFGTMKKMYSIGHNPLNRRTTRNPTSEWVKKRPFSYKTTVDISSTGMPASRNNCCPVSDCKDAKRKYSRPSRGNTNCTNPLHKLHTPSNNSIAVSSAVSMPVKQDPQRKVAGLFSFYYLFSVGLLLIHKPINY